MFGAYCFLSRKPVREQEYIYISHQLQYDLGADKNQLIQNIPELTFFNLKASPSISAAN